ncbi:hypothetical protein ACHQM5_030287 [Ranunculus cassubicifolius]
MAKNYYVSELQGVIQILKETCKLLQRNKTIFLFITLATTTVYTLLIFANIFSLISLLQNLSFAAVSLLQMDPKAPEYLKQVFKIEEKTFLIILIEFLYFLLTVMFSLLSMVSTIYVSSMSYLGKDITLKELCLYIKQIWVRPMVTWFYSLLMSLGLLLLILPEYIFLVIERGSLIMLAVGIILLLSVTILSFYLLLVWKVGMVTSVLEESCGLEALGKAERLISGKKLVGFILMFLLEVPFNVVYLSIISTNSSRTIPIQFLVIFLAMIFQIWINIWSMMTYTVYYFECKEIHGEQVGLQEEMGYTKVATVPSFV